MIHIDLKERIETHLDAMQCESVALRRDAIELRLSNGVELTLRFASEHEYAMTWYWGDATMSIDTAPLRRGLLTYPNHLHTPAGEVVADPITEIGAAPWHNVRALIERLLDAPLLGYEPACADPSRDAYAQAPCNP